MQGQLKKFADVIDIQKCGEPTTLAIITGTGFGYERDDGIGVIPIGALAP